MSNSRSNHTAQMNAEQALIDGFTKHAATLLTLLVGGSTVKVSDVVTVLQARIAAIRAALAAKVAFLAAVAAMREEMGKTATLVSGVREALKVAFAGQVELLADFGLKPRKAAAPRSPQQKAAAAAKAKATRAARHTMGSKQKKAVTGAAAPPAAAAPSNAAATPAAEQSPPAAPAVTPPGGTGGTPKS